MLYSKNNFQGTLKKGGNKEGKSEKRGENPHISGNWMELDA